MYFAGVIPQKQLQRYSYNPFFKLKTINNQKGEQ